MHGVDAMHDARVPYALAIYATVNDAGKRTMTDHLRPEPIIDSCMTFGQVLADSEMVRLLPREFRTQTQQ